MKDEEWEEARGGGWSVYEGHYIIRFQPIVSFRFKKGERRGDEREVIRNRTGIDRKGSWSLSSHLIDRAGRSASDEAS